MSEEAAIQTLIEALKYYRDGFHSSAYSTMGFTALAAGWLITSQSARDFIHSHRWLGWAAITMIVASFTGYWKMAYGVLRLSSGISVELYNKQAYGLYEHYSLNPEGVNGYILIQGLATLFIVLVLIAILRNPKEEEQKTATKSKKKSAKSK